MAQNYNKKISKNFNLSEFIKSDTASKYNIDNSPSEKVVQTIEELVTEVLQPIRDNWEGTIKISSGYRCEKLNRAVGSTSKNSDHLYGAAADISAKDKSKNVDLWNMIRFMLNKNKIQVRQLIWEKGTKKCPQWIHISINHDKNSYKNNQILYLY